MIKQSLCSCGKPIDKFSHCKDCIARIQSNFEQLCKTLSNRHRGAGGAAICICEAGCGSTPECSALSQLMIAITTNDPILRYSIADAIGWSSWMQLPLIRIEKQTKNKYE